MNDEDDDDDRPFKPEFRFPNGRVDPNKVNAKAISILIEMLEEIADAPSTEHDVRVEGYDLISQLEEGLCLENLNIIATVLNSPLGPELAERFDAEMLELTKPH